MLKKIANTLYAGYEYLLTKEIMGNPVPSHIAIIQDGNRRYAAKLDKPSYYGHFYGANTTEKVMEWCLELGIRQLTIYALSTENFNRPYAERIPLFRLFKQKFDEICVDERVHRNEIQFRVIGNVDLLPLDVRLAAKRAERITQQYDKFCLNVALAYGGRWEFDLTKMEKTSDDGKDHMNTPNCCTKAESIRFGYREKNIEEVVKDIKKTLGLPDIYTAMNFTSSS